MGVSLRYEAVMHPCKVNMGELVTGLVIYVDCTNFVMGNWHNFHQTYQQNSSALSTKELVTGLVICVDSAILPPVGGRVTNQFTIFTKLVSKIPQPL